jgi:rfaE bifunctional protein kinase chain/domain/rfaE bifunctional protein nucleotidyltransferase chain/domain
MAKSKILIFSDLQDKIIYLRKQKKKIVLCHGVFDLFHQGHIEHLIEAKKQGNILIVTITPDKYVNKGPGRPLFNSSNRLKHLASLEIVDYVSENQWPTAIETIKLIKPDIYVKGPDYKKNKNDETKNIILEKNIIKKIGGKIYYTKGETLSSSKLINANTKFHSKEENKFINIIKKKYNFKDIEKIINKFSKLNVLLVGESIIDQYIFSDAIGKSSKEPVLVVQEKFERKYIGGILSVAQLISNFANKVTIITFVGKNKDDISFIKKNLNKNISFKFLTKKDSPTITKTRIIDNYSKRNLLGLYKFNNNSISKIEENNFLKLIKKEEKKNNQILFSDFGHGIITKKIANKFSNISNFTSLNVQLNSSNQNSLGISKYKKAKVLIINIGELKREIRDNDLDVLSLGKKLKKKLDCNLLIVTMGSAGSYLVNFKNNKSTFCPAFAKKIIDRVGAGDVMHSIVSMCLKNKVEADLSLFISSLAAAHSVENIGNSNILDKKILLRSIKYLLK